MARQLLLKAWALKKSFDLAGNLGLIEVRLGMMREAAEHLRWCVESFPAARDALQSEKLAKVEAQLADVRKEVGALRIIIAPEGRELEGAEVFIDNESIGRSPIRDEVFVDPGERVIKARLRGYAEASTRVRVVKGGSDNVTLTLRPDPALTPAALPSDAPKSTKSVPLLIAGGALAAVGIGIGIGYTVASRNKMETGLNEFKFLKGEGTNLCKDPIDDVNRNPCDSIETAISDTQKRWNVARASYIAGGLVAAVTITYALWPRNGQRREASKSLPAILPIEAALRVGRQDGWVMLKAAF